MRDKLALLSARLQEEQSTMSRNRRDTRVSKLRLITGAASRPYLH